MAGINIEEIINMNYRVLTLLGIATAIISDYKKTTAASGNLKNDWFLQAVNDVVYLKKPIPQMYTEC